VTFFVNVVTAGATVVIGWWFAGLFGLSWFVAWWFFSSEAPSSHKTISNEEKTYIDSALAQNTSNVTNKVQ